MCSIFWGWPYSSIFPINIIKSTFSYTLADNPVFETSWGWISCLPFQLYYIFGAWVASSLLWPMLMNPCTLKFYQWELFYTNLRGFTFLRVISWVTSNLETSYILSQLVFRDDQYNVSLENGIMTLCLWLIRGDILFLYPNTKVGERQFSLMCR